MQAICPFVHFIWLQLYYLQLHPHKHTEESCHRAQKTHTIHCVSSSAPELSKSFVWAQGSPSPQLSAYKANTDLDKISLESPASKAIDRDHVPGQNDMPTPVANLRHDIDAAADDREDMEGTLVAPL